MKNIYTFFILFILFSYNSFSYGQDFYMIKHRKEALKIRNNTMAVVLEKPDAKTEKRLQKNAKELAAYHTAIEERNVFLKEALEEGWLLSKEIIYVSSDEADALKKKKARGITILRYTNNATRTGRTDNDPGTPTYNPARTMPGNSIAGPSIPGLSIYNTDFKYPIAITNVPVMEDKSTQITYMVAHLQNLILDAEQKKLSSYKKLAKDIASQSWKLSGKTILVADKITSKNLKKAFEDNGLKGHYNFTIETATDEKIKQVMLDRDENYAFFMVYPDGRIVMGSLAYEYYVIDAATRRIVYNDSTLVIGSNGLIHTNHLDKLNKKLSKPKS